MGLDIKRPDVQLVIDYATGQTVCRFHLDLPIKQKSVKKLYELMEEAKWQEVKSLLLAEHKNAEPFVDLFLRPLLKKG